MFRKAAVAALVLTSSSAGPRAHAATMPPPMLDITRQCDANSRHNATAMSECVVAESEARSEILQKWSTLPNARAEKCVKLGRKTKRYPYVAIAKCLSVEAVQDVQPPVASPASTPGPAAPAPVPARAAPPAAPASDNYFRMFQNKLFGTGK